MTKNKETTFQKRLAAKIEDYAKVFRIDDLNNANDKSTLEIMLKTELMIEDLQEQIQLLMDESAVENASNIKKLADLLRDSTNTITNLQKTLNIDRRTRKTEETDSVADYIRALRRDAKEFIDQRIINVYCPDCKIMVGRIYPVHEHTAFSVSFQCSQCDKLIRSRREAKDILFDIKDSQWRRKYKAEIIQPKIGKDIGIEVEDELYLGGDSELLIEESPDLEQHVIEEDLELGE